MTMMTLRTGNRRRKIIIILCCLFLFYALRLEAREAKFADLLITNNAEQILVYARVTDCFTGQMEAAILAGVPTVCSFLFHSGILKRTGINKRSRSRTKIMIKVRPHIDARETRRRKRERLIIIATIAVIIALSLLEGYLYRKESVLPLSSNVLIFGLINVNVILVIFLLFLIIRNVVKLVFERRRGVIGSKLRTKLVAAFVGLSLVPPAILFFFSINFLSYNIDNWFNLKIGET